MKMFMMVLKLQSGQDFHLKKFKEAYYRKNICEVTFLLLCTSSDSDGASTKFP